MSSEFSKNIGHRIKTLRKNLGYSQEEVARQLGIHRPSVSQIEHGERELSAEELTKLSQFFGITETDILNPRVDDPTITNKEKLSQKQDLTITFYRHGEATDDVYDQYGGWGDPELSPKGVSRTYIVAETLKREQPNFDVIFTSPLKRAKKMAEIFGQVLRIDVKVLQYLKERNTYGLLCGINKRVAKQKFPDLVKDYNDGKYVLASERKEDFEARIPLIFEYIKRSGKKNVCCITHGKVLSAIIEQMLSMKKDVLEDNCKLVVSLEGDKVHFIQSQGITFKKQ